MFAGAASAMVMVGGAIGVFAWYYTAQTGPTATSPIVISDAADVDLTEQTGSIRSTSRPNLAPETQPTGLVEVAPDGGLEEIGTVVIHNLSDSGNMRLAALPDDSLIEQGPYGILPRVSTAGVRPLDAYARPTSAAGRADRIAIVIGGLGINANGTDRAIAALPGNITLALAPYGKGLEEIMADARGAGHEVLLQIPMEPLNYPANDPGAHTLTRAADAATNIDRLHWLMSRTSNYVGVVNYLGARFTNDVDALAPVLGEIGDRGLLYLDDGSSPRSKARDVAGGRAPFLRADINLDTELSAAAIDQRLDELQRLARQRGFAIATGSAFPITIERVAEFARKAADRGIELVPISALILPSRA
jgi:polysaccharide deacetylase 2 family uncharacterized protein YibQ